MWLYAHNFQCKMYVDKVPQITYILYMNIYTMVSFTAGKISLNLE